MLDRFYIPGEWPSDVVAMGESEAHHLSHVLRKQRGDHIEIFDGCGRSAEAEVTSVGRRDVEVRVLTHPHHQETPAAAQVWLAVAPPKGERLKQMIEKLTEIGVTRITLLNTERSVVLPGESKLDKLQQVAIAACKQCRRNTLPEMTPNQAIDDVLNECGSSTSLWVADQRGSATYAPLEQKRDGDCCFIGPEGGFTESERDQLQSAGAKPVSFSPHVLRIETAAVLAAGWLMGRNRAE